MANPFPGTQVNSPLKNSQLLRRLKKFKPSRMAKYASALHFSCSLYLGFLNELPDEDFFNTQLKQFGQGIVGQQARSQRAVKEQSRQAIGALFPQQQAKNSGRGQDGKAQTKILRHSVRSLWVYRMS
jgi:hypothetical protein